MSLPVCLAFLQLLCGLGCMKIDTSDVGCPLLNTYNHFKFKAWFHPTMENRGETFQLKVFRFIPSDLSKHEAAITDQNCVIATANSIHQGQDHFSAKKKVALAQKQTPISNTLTTIQKESGSVEVLHSLSKNVSSSLK